MSDNKKVTVLGRKDDKNKLRFDLIRPEFEEELVRVLTIGANRYGANNWQQVDDFDNRYYAALRRHLNAWRRGKKLNIEDGQILYHMAQVAVNAMFLLWGDMNADSNVPQPKNIDPTKTNGTEPYHACSGEANPAHSDTARVDRW